MKKSLISLMVVVAVAAMAAPSPDPKPKGNGGSVGTAKPKQFFDNPFPGVKMDDPSTQIVTKFLCRGTTMIGVMVFSSGAGAFPLDLTENPCAGGPNSEGAIPLDMTPEGPVQAPTPKLGI
jgi:hypothetical protein